MCKILFFVFKLSIKKCYFKINFKNCRFSFKFLISFSINFLQTHQSKETRKKLLVKSIKIPFTHNNQFPFNFTCSGPRLVEKKPVEGRKKQLEPFNIHNKYLKLMIGLIDFEENYGCYACRSIFLREVQSSSGFA